MRKMTFTLVAFVPIAFVTGCAEDPTGTAHDETLTTELSFTPDHVHTLTPVAFEVVIRDDHGMHMTDFEQVAVEHRISGSSTWRSIEMTLHQDHYTGTYTFTSSGDYEMRVMGMAHAGHAMEEMHHLEGGLHIGRAHVEQAGYRIEYESFPGHIHEGSSPTLTFWVQDATQRTPITGLTPQITCQETGIAAHVLSASESVAGEYAGVHQIEAAGPATITVVFQDPQGTATVEGAFSIEVSHAH